MCLQFLNRFIRRNASNLDAFASASNSLPHACGHGGGFGVRAGRNGSRGYERDLGAGQAGGSGQLDDNTLRHSETATRHYSHVPSIFSTSGFGHADICAQALGASPPSAFTDSQVNLKVLHPHNHPERVRVAERETHNLPRDGNEPDYSSPGGGEGGRGKLGGRVPGLSGFMDLCSANFADEHVWIKLANPENKPRGRHTHNYECREGTTIVL